MKRLPLTTLLALSALTGCAKGAPTSAAPDSYSPSLSSAEPAATESAAPSDGGSGERSGVAIPDMDYSVADSDDAEPPAAAPEVEMPAEPSPASEMEADEAPTTSSAKIAVDRGRRARRSREKRDRRAKRGKKKKPLARAKPVRPDPSEFEEQLQAGRLTAGAFDDTLNPHVLSRFARRMSQNPQTHEVAELVSGPMTVVRVVDERGRPIHDANVRIDVGRRGASVPTGTDGRAVFFSSWDLRSADQEQQRGLRAVVKHGHQTINARVDEGETQTITLPRAQADSVRAVDIALVIDATGSMGDELEYLKVELRNIARTVDRAFPQVEQRFALVVYRDDGDDYVSRSFDFTSSLARFERSLGRQRADGGGDYPEAMHSALEDATELSWSNDSAKMVFLVADAPPHGERMLNTMDAVDTLRADGVAFYPVAASGVAAEAEIVMRAAAASSGGQYLFLTDDSGVGNSHAEPHIPCYEVQALRDIMIRMVHSEIAGERISPDSRRMVRSVGRSRDGVCELMARAR